VRRCGSGCVTARWTWPTGSSPPFRRVRCAIPRALGHVLTTRARGATPADGRRTSGSPAQGITSAAGATWYSCRLARMRGFSSLRAYGVLMGGTHAVHRTCKPPTARRWNQTPAEATSRAAKTLIMSSSERAKGQRKGAGGEAAQVTRGWMTGCKGWVDSDLLRASHSTKPYLTLHIEAPQRELALTAGGMAS
jgi:hypothetical protein